jgi:hypothetical protein
MLVTLALFALFWGGSLVAQGYLYQQPAEHLPARAAVAALLVGLFLTVWVWIDKRNPGRYDTFFEFAPYSTLEYSEFTAVRWTAAGGKLREDAEGKRIETAVRFKRRPGAKTNPFVEEGTGQSFKLNDSTMMTAAFLVPVDEGGEPVRFDADLKKGAIPEYTPERRFTEVGGSRYIVAQTPEQLGVMYVPSTSVVVISLLLNFLLFVVWFVALWPVMRFGWGHSLGFAAVLGVVTMLVVMPLLFKPNRVPKAPDTEAAAVTGDQSSVTREQGTVTTCPRALITDHLLSISLSSSSTALSSCAPRRFLNRIAPFASST